MASFSTGYTTAAAAVERSISHTESAVLAMQEDLTADERLEAALEALRPLGLEDYVEESAGLVDAWGTRDGQEWRLKVVDGLQHGIGRYVR